MTSSSWNKIHAHDIRYDLEEERGDVDILVEEYLRNLALILPKVPAGRVDQRLHLASELTEELQILLRSMASRDKKRSALCIGTMIVELIRAGHTFGLPMDSIVYELAAPDPDIDRCFLI